MKCFACNKPLGEKHSQMYGPPWIDQAGGSYHDCPIGGLYGFVREKDCKPTWFNKLLVWLASDFRAARTYQEVVVTE